MTLLNDTNVLAFWLLAHNFKVRKGSALLENALNDRQVEVRHLQRISLLVPADPEMFLGSDRPNFPAHNGVPEMIGDHWVIKGCVDNRACAVNSHDLKALNLPDYLLAGLRKATKKCSNGVENSPS